ncbi:Capsule polysaccharide biosynthesis protein [Bradyrhizobium shewense]|uniref:Capsule polysaccharide biosynthesis protein n=1 Tax=Bradyrhizobium shewense TaxID=1761772 RepID=A0A1C3WRE8_9BRAD|nr:capsule biosynthesis protein [Bradyrhizobium shewense]SCB42551.1 Capsule polysaccharide biosynthesis protein [Bradyrhizobium shewense]
MATSASQPIAQRPAREAPPSLPDWHKYLKNSPTWDKALQAAKGGEKVLVATSVGGLAAATILESLIAVSLTLRGANVRLLLCDAALPACLHIHAGKVKSTEVITEYRLKKEVCPGCLARGKSVYDKIGLAVSYYSEFISDAERANLKNFAATISSDDISAYTAGGLALGEHALAGALRFFACGTLPQTTEADQVLRRYFEAALITELVTSRYCSKYAPQVAVFHHGIYVPQGIIGEVCRARGVRVANWQVGYRKRTFIFSHKKTYHHTLLEEPDSNWKNFAWNEALQNDTLAYLKSRWYGTDDWIWFHDQPKHNAEMIMNETGIDFSRPTISLLTNVFWDAQLHYKANAFRDMLDWLVQTIEYFKGRPDLQLAIRIHPAEVRGAIPSRQPLVDEITTFFPKLPENVFVIPPDSQVSTYVLCENSDSVIIYGTKTGVELTAMGIPVIVAGEAWIRNKGLTRDATSPDSYFAILDKLPAGKRLDARTVDLAQKYAFHFFFRRFIPISYMEPASGGVPYEIGIDNIEQLLPRSDVGLDVICDGILHGSEFIYPAETRQGAT